MNSWTKLSRPTHSVLVPKASSTWKDCRTACAAGQKKNTPTMASCGNTKAQGSQAERKRTRFSMKFRNEEATRLGRAAGQAGWRLLLVGLLELGQQLVATRGDGVQRVLGGLLAAPDLFGFLVLDGTDLHVVAQADAA